MPNYDGVYGLENIKKINPNAIVIIFTGNSDETITHKIIQLNATEILQKPYPLDKLISLVKSIKNHTQYGGSIDILSKKL